MPQAPWVFRQTWVNLLFAHWRIDPAVVRPLVSPKVEIDTFRGETWVGVVPFGIRDATWRGMPALSRLSRFPELNLRLYVTRDGKPGVWFLSLDAANQAAVWAARTFFSLPYQHASMSVRTHNGVVDYRSSRRSKIPVNFAATYGPRSGVFAAAPGSLEHWLIERYCLYTARPDGTLLRLDIHHRPWPLQIAHGHIEFNDLPRPHGITLEGGPLLHFAAEQKMVMWLPEAVAG